MSFRQCLHPPVNRICEKFFAKYPRTHIIKWLISHRMHRILVWGILKGVLWRYFRVMNRIELQNTHFIYPKQKSYRGEPFLIVENHNVDMDVMMHMATWAHLGYLNFVFTTEGSFDTRYPFLPILSHLIEMIPRYGTGEASILRMVNRLKMGDIVNIFPAGTYPEGKYANSGLVTEGFSGATRLAYTYWKQTGKKLVIQPTCSIGGNIAYPPRKYGLGAIKKRIINHKIIIKFGQPFTFDFSPNPSYEEISQKAHQLDMHIAEIWGQKKLIPNYGKLERQKESGTGKTRIYK